MLRSSVALGRPPLELVVRHAAFVSLEAEHQGVAILGWGARRGGLRRKRGGSGGPGRCAGRRGRRVGSSSGVQRHRVRRVVRQAAARRCGSVSVLAQAIRASGRIRTAVASRQIACVASELTVPARCSKPSAGHGVRVPPRSSNSGRPWCINGWAVGTSVASRARLTSRVPFSGCAPGVVSAGSGSSKPGSGGPTGGWSAVRRARRTKPRAGRSAPGSPRRTGRAARGCCR